MSESQKSTVEDDEVDALAAIVRDVPWTRLRVDDEDDRDDRGDESRDGTSQLLSAKVNKWDAHMAEADGIAHASNGIIPTRPEWEHIEPTGSTPSSSARSYAQLNKGRDSGHVKKQGLKQGRGSFFCGPQNDTKKAFRFAEDEDEEDELSDSTNDSEEDDDTVCEDGEHVPKIRESGSNNADDVRSTQPRVPIWESPESREQERNSDGPPIESSREGNANYSATSAGYGRGGGRGGGGGREKRKGGRGGKRGDGGGRGRGGRFDPQEYGSGQPTNRGQGGGGGRGGERYDSPDYRNERSSRGGEGWDRQYSNRGGAYDAREDNYRQGYENRQDYSHGNRYDQPPPDQMRGYQGGPQPTSSIESYTSLEEEYSNWSSVDLGKEIARLKKRTEAVQRMMERQNPTTQRPKSCEGERDWQQPSQYDLEQERLQRRMEEDRLRGGVEVNSVVEARADKPKRKKRGGGKKKQFYNSNGVSY